MILNRGIYQGRRYISEAAVAEMTRRQTGNTSRRATAWAGRLAAGASATALPRDDHDDQLKARPDPGVPGAARGLPGGRRQVPGGVQEGGRRAVRASEVMAPALAPTTTEGPSARAARQEPRRPRGETETPGPEFRDASTVPPDEISRGPGVVPQCPKASDPIRAFPTSEAHPGVIPEDDRASGGIRPRRSARAYPPTGCCTAGQSRRPSSSPSRRPCTRARGRDRSSARRDFSR